MLFGILDCLNRKRGML